MVGIKFSGDNIQKGKNIIEQNEDTIKEFSELTEEQRHDYLVELFKTKSSHQLIGIIGALLAIKGDIKPKGLQAKGLMKMLGKAVKGNESNLQIYIKCAQICFIKKTGLDNGNKILKHMYEEAGLEFEEIKGNKK